MITILFLIIFGVVCIIMALAMLAVIVISMYVSYQEKKHGMYWYRPDKKD